VNESDRVAVLRPLRVDDAEDVAAGCDDPLTQRFLPHLPSPYTTADALWWINEGAPAVFAAGGTAYAIADPTTDRVLGGGGYHPIREGVTEVGYWVAPWARGRGVARAAATALSAEAIGHGAARLELYTDPENTASQRVAVAAGFGREALQRAKGVGRAGDRLDRILWARLATDPDGPRPRLIPDLPGRGVGGERSGGELTDGVVALRPLRAEDADDTYRLRTLPEVIATSVPPQQPTHASIARQCALSEGRWLAGERADLIVEDAATGAYAGEIGLYYWEPPTQQAMIGYSLMPEWRGRGYATRAARLVAAWAFEHVGVARLIAGTAPENVGSQRVLERAGFVREGYQRARLPGPDGTRIDDLLYALLPGTAPSAQPG
jgi:RimJ/RimL family protein N-acetyltransferase